MLALQWGGNTKAWNDKAVIIVSAAYSTYILMLHSDIPLSSHLYSQESPRSCSWPGRNIWGIKPWSP
jgi:hypothetical protein